MPDLPLSPPSKKEAIRKLKENCQSIINDLNGPFKSRVGIYLVDGYLMCGQIDYLGVNSLKVDVKPKKDDRKNLIAVSEMLQTFIPEIKKFRTMMQGLVGKLRNKSPEEKQLLALLTDPDKVKHIAPLTAQVFELNGSYNQLFDRVEADFDASVGKANALLHGFYKDVT